ncbi:MAG: HlyD family efflux transporter periplasmic adaptor subunit [Marinilabiliaceae bacterium]|nr:HlyD family efflux transporter periplasmic adaptor subunit [Marinilabiliaceae bacterium]
MNIKALDIIYKLMNPETINIRSDEVNEIMGKVPSSLVRYGITVIATVIIAIIVFSFFFRYPDIIYGNFFIQTANPPAFLLSRSSGKIQSLFVDDRDSVDKGELLAIIENPADFKQYQNLKQLIEINPKPLNVTDVWDSLCGNSSRLGDMQMPFANYLKAIDDYQTFIELASYRKKRDDITRKIAELEAHKLLYEQQVSDAQTNYQLAKNSHERHVQLLAGNFITKVEFEINHKEYLAQRMALTNSEISLSNLKLTILENEQQLTELFLSEKQSESERIANINQCFENLQSAVAEHENRYCLISPVAGQVAFSGIWKENQNVGQGQHVMTIVPFDKTQIICRINIPVHRAGKVRENQEVNLKFIDFPDKEYGIVVGKLHSLSTVPDSVYVGTIFLPDTLVTSYGKTLPFRQNMMGMAEIVTEDVRLAERLIYPLKAIYKKSIE